MGITVMENFDVADVASLAGAPHNITIGAHSGMISYDNIKTFTEEGVRRTSYATMSNMYDGSGAAYGKVLQIPIPAPASNVNADRTYYASFRVRFLTGTTNPQAATVSKVLPSNSTFLGISSYVGAYGYSHQYMLATVVRGDNLAGGDANKLRLFAGNTATAATAQAQFTPDADGWFHIEVFKPAGSFFYTIWLNDFMYTQVTASGNPNVVNANSNALCVFLGRSTGYFTGYWGIEVTDVIVIDPTTAGQNYRFGSSGRVLSMDYTADLVNEWVAAPSATLSHRQMMMIDKSVPDANNILTATTVGQREEYAMQPIPAKFGAYVPVIKVQPRVMNAGASSHSMAVEMDWGTGRAEIGSKTVAPGGAYDTTPIIMTTKPNGDPWTAADFASAKAGFSVKS